MTTEEAIEMLNEIKEEIKSIERYGTNNSHDLWLRTPEEIKKDALNIIDKYIVFGLS